MEKYRYFNYNGAIYAQSHKVLNIQNRSFRYGDGLFESMCYKDGHIQFLDFHIERLHKGMMLLKMEGAKLFDAFFIRGEVTQLIKKNNLKGNIRIRFAVFREGAGLYAPETNKVGFLIEVEEFELKANSQSSTGLIIDVFTDHKKSINNFSALKSSNALLYVLAGIYRKNHGLDEVLLLNENGLLCEASGSNIFIWYRGVLYTPALSEGCVEGVMRRVVMEVAKLNNIEVVEAQINPEILNEAEEIFLTNAVQGVQWVLGYKKKRFFNKFSKDLHAKVVHWQHEQLEESN